MKRFASLGFAILLVVGLSVCAFAHTGALVNGEPPVTDLDVSGATVSSLHDETIGNPIVDGQPTYDYKGWWWVTLTNSTSSAWGSVSINPGATDLVAIVQGTGLTDEWGFSGNSVVVNRTATYDYTGSLGSRDYGSGVTGFLWSNVVVNFASAVEVGQKVSFKIYTDNSYYEGPHASTFTMNLTANPVPEPSSMLALASGLVGLLGFARRRK